MKNEKVEITRNSKLNPKRDSIKISTGQTLVFEDSISGILAAENSKAEKIIIVKSSNIDYSKWNYDTIETFWQIDKSIFE